MKLPTRATVVIDVSCLGVLLWLYLGDLLNYRRALAAEVTALVALPHAGFAAVALALTFAAAGIAGWGALRDKPDSFRGYRLLPIVLVVTLFADLFVITGSHDPPIPSADQLEATVRIFVETLQERSSASAVPSAPAQLEEWVSQLGPPPYLVHGQRPERYALQLRTGCDKPVLEAPGSSVGTLIYCLAPGAREGWVTVVALPAGELFGEPQMYSAGGAVRWWRVAPVPPEGPGGSGEGEGEGPEPGMPPFAPPFDGG